MKLPTLILATSGMVLAGAGAVDLLGDDSVPDTSPTAVAPVSPGSGNSSAAGSPDLRWHASPPCVTNTAAGPAEHVVVPVLPANRQN